MTNRPLYNRVLTLTAVAHQLDTVELVTKALASDKRLAILRFLGTHTCSVLEIAEALDLPQSTATQHINILEKAGLIKTDLQPASRGLQKLCARVFDQIVVQLPAETERQETFVEVAMPIGAYVQAEVVPTCGLLTEHGIIGHLDDPAAFYEPERIHAQLLWFRRGHIEYRFPNRMPPDAVPETLELSFEVCSEAPLHHEDWPSDITVWINGLEVGTWTSPADFGGERGALTPEWWGEVNSQYGLLKVWKVTTHGSYVDGVRVSEVSLAHLKLGNGGTIPVRLGVRENAHNVGGLNLFGSRFGNYPQDLVLKQRFQRGEGQNRPGATEANGKENASANHP
jgi:predicted transcriptional regulator